MNRRRSILLVAMPMLVGCEADTLLSPPPASNNLYWELRLNHHAIQLSKHAPHNQVQLETTPYGVDGLIWVPDAVSPSSVDSLLVASPAVFVSRDSSRVRVSRDGLVTGIAVQTGNVYVVATRTIAGITQSDSALVRVTDVVSLPAIRTFRIGPAENDSAKVAVELFSYGRITKTLKVTIQDAGNIPITGVPVYLNPSNVSVALIANRYDDIKKVAALQPGNVLLRAESYVYGAVLIDTLTFTVGYPVTYALGSIYIGFRLGGLNGFGYADYAVVDVGPGTTLRWINQTGAPANVLFEDPTHVLPATQDVQNSGGGDMIAIPGNASLAMEARTRYRRFLTPGTYVFRVEPLGYSRTIIVHPK